MPYAKIQKIIKVHWENLYFSTLEKSKEMNK